MGRGGGFPIKKYFTLFIVQTNHTLHWNNCVSRRTLEQTNPQCATVEELRGPRETRLEGLLALALASSFLKMV